MSGYSCRSGVICHSSELHQPRQGEERQYILIRGSGKLRPAYQFSYSSSYGLDLPAPAAPSSGAPTCFPLCGSHLISNLLLPLCLFSGPSALWLSPSSTTQHCLSVVPVIAVLSPACCVLANSPWPWSGVWLAVFRGAWLRWRRPVFPLCQTPAVCLCVCLYSPSQSSPWSLSEPHTGPVHSPSAHS